jgi:vacuolar-type H+-ATPase subunit I/STV1
MKNALKNIFPIRSKENFLTRVSFLCFVLGLLIQIIVIIRSFSWLPEQFGLPKTYPDIFILATVLTLVPALNYFAFVYFLLLFISVFHGLDLLGHPWFYHLLGMLIFDIGMILFRKMDRIARQTTK